MYLVPDFFGAGRFNHIFHSHFIGTGAMISLPQFQRSNLVRHE